MILLHNISDKVFFLFSFNILLDFGVHFKVLNIYIDFSQQLPEKSCAFTCQWILILLLTVTLSLH